MGEKPRALLCAFAVVPSTSAVSRRIDATLKTLQPQYAVDILVEKAASQPHVERYQGAKLLRVPLKAATLLGQSSDLSRAIRRQLSSEDYALVHIFDPIAGYPIAAYKSRARYRMIFELLSLPSAYATPLGERALENSRYVAARLRRLEHFCLLHADHIAVDDSVIARQLQALNIDATRIHMQHNAPAPVLDVLGGEERSAPDAPPSFIPLLELPPLPPYGVADNPVSTLVEEADPDDVVELQHEDESDATLDFLTVDSEAAPPPSKLNPWLAQLVHGYCPPESGVFDRPPPPTTMPGRDT